MDEKQLTNNTANLASEEVEEILQLEKELEEAHLPEDLLEKTKTMVSRLRRVAKYGYFSREYEPIAKYVSWICQIPWENYSVDNLDLNNAKNQLDMTHFGLQQVKERILEYIAILHLQRLQQSGGDASVNNPQVLVNQVTQQAPQNIAQVSSTQPVQQAPSQIEKMVKLEGSSAHAPIICLVGVQGIGKTSIAKSIALAMGRQFVRISLGGIAHVSELRGRSRSEIDSEPGQIVKSLIRTDVMNPLILMDEIDKVSDFGGVRADVMATLLEILDPEQNATFRDHYIDYPVDLSKVMFVCTANNLGGISAALLDRLEIVRMSSYTDEEKMHIAKDYLLPKVIEATGIDPNVIFFSESVWPLLIRPLGFDAGIRQLERNITTLVRKIAKKMVEGQGNRFEVTPENFRQYLPEDFGVYS
ncbi:AAA family ATPase [Candidatus Dojkabacteria bacterium]|uniref:AAA family ATPase n=1 Tax=Candidatus Dojkabacteria bacterium TaxID=2099670 RepID=A0A955I8N3_9BACT|nr:AAA family ATPase [Candidatus Dojkabacteria bacterium]